MEESVVLIIGAGPAGLATSACLNVLSIPNIVLEREDCHASLWKKRAYDRLKLHLAKQFCELPHMHFPPEANKYVPRREFISYLDQYAKHFQITPRCNRFVELASYHKDQGKWRVVAKNAALNFYETYVAKFLVVATGENSEGIIPKVPGLDTISGDFIHSNKYENGENYVGKNVLVVGCGNSGMEIAYDLSNWGARTSIVVRSPVHLLTKEIVCIGMTLLTYRIPVTIVDYIVVFLSKLRFGNLTRYGISAPTRGPFVNKVVTGRTPTIDVGAVDRIKKGEIQVFPGIKCINGKEVEFENGETERFDSIIFATGYRSTVMHWLKDGESLFNERGMPRERFPNHRKGKNGLFCAGFSGRGLEGIATDARTIAKDVSLAMYLEQSAAKV